MMRSMLAALLLALLLAACGSPSAPTATAIPALPPAATATRAPAPPTSTPDIAAQRQAQAEAGRATLVAGVYATKTAASAPPGKARPPVAATTHAQPAATARPTKPAPTQAPARAPPTATSRPPTPVPAAAADGSAWVSDSSPTRSERVTVYGQLLAGGVGVAGATMSATWHYKTTTSYCSGTTAANGIASCTRDISSATPGYTVRIDVSFSLPGRGAGIGATYTSFTPAGVVAAPTSPPAPPSGGGGGRIGAICRDGSHSNATGRGACSHHGGVDHWLYAP